MPEPEDQLRRYADAAAAAVPPIQVDDVVARPTASARPRWLQLAAAAAVLLLVAGAVVVALRDDGDETLHTADPTEDEEPAVSTSTTVSDGAGVDSGPGESTTTTLADEPAAMTIGTMPLATTEREVQCHGVPYPTSAFGNPTGAEAGTDPAATALRAWLADAMTGPKPGATGWRRLLSTSVVAVFGRGEPGAEYQEVVLRDEGDGFRVTGWNAPPMGCQPQTVVPGRSLTYFDVLERDGDAIEVLALELSCTGGRPLDDRSVTAQVASTDDAVQLLLTVEPVPGEQHTCPGTPPTRIRIELGEPLGDRPILDLGTYPAWDADGYRVRPPPAGTPDFH